MLSALELKVPPPVLALISAGIGYLLYLYVSSMNVPTSSMARILAALCVACGITLDLVAIRRFSRAQTTISPLSPTNTTELITDGIYARTRNPMYLGLLLILLGFFMWLGAPLAVFALFFFHVAVTQLQIIPEERILTERFPEAFEKWSASVPRWI